MRVELGSFCVFAWRGDISCQILTFRDIGRRGGAQRRCQSSVQDRPGRLAEFQTLMMIFHDASL